MRVFSAGARVRSPTHKSRDEEALYCNGQGHGDFAQPGAICARGAQARRTGRREAH